MRGLKNQLYAVHIVFRIRFTVHISTLQVVAQFIPRRRFSHSAVSALREVLDSLASKNEEERKDECNMDPGDFAQLSREEQLKV